MRSELLAALIMLVATPTLAKDRPVTDDERAKLVAAVTAQGCSGGTMEFDDDGYYEVEDASCNDGREYELKFDTAFKFTSKKLDD
jgi:hypothetical protein